MKRILSIDGGGIRGALTSCMLVELEKQIGKPCREIFGMVAGTSTGALIASAIAVGIPATTILAIYSEDAPKIFSLPAWRAWPLRLAEGYAYPSSRIRDVLIARFGAAAQWSLNECPIRILLTATKVNGHGLYLVQDTPKNAGTTGKLSLVECATASAAAPTYVSEQYISALGGELVGWAADGGIACCANPVYEACVEAFWYDDFQPADTRVISLGTGYYPSTAVNPPSGFLGRLSLSLDALLYNAGKQQTDTVQRHWPGILRRFNWQLPQPIDMADAAAIPGLIALGKAEAAKLDWQQILKG